MADFTALKTAIQNAIKQNGNEEITGNLLQEMLLAIVTTLGDGSINDLVTALGSEAQARSQADSTLQQNIDAEAQARSQADSTLQQNIDAEAQARSQADSTLQQNIDAEATTRGQADTALGGRIDGVVSSIEAINDAIENGYVYAGIATPSSTPASGKVFYLALTAGTYTNFGNTAVAQGINILKYNGSTWSLDAFIVFDDAPAPSSQKLVKSGGVFDEVMKNGSAFDLSAYNGGATYADLNAALTALNALPAAYKRGGMSMKFILSSDNKYVQYRLMANAWSTNVTQWQGVDDEPTDGSDNLVKSGGVANKLIHHYINKPNCDLSLAKTYCMWQIALFGTKIAKRVTIRVREEGSFRLCVLNTTSKVVTNIKTFTATQEQRDAIVTFELDEQIEIQEDEVFVIDPMGQYVTAYYNGSQEVMPTVDLSTGSLFYDRTGIPLIQITGEKEYIEELVNKTNELEENKADKLVLNEEIQRANQAEEAIENEIKKFALSEWNNGIVGFVGDSFADASSNIFTKSGQLYHPVYPEVFAKENSYNCTIVDRALSGARIIGYIKGQAINIADQYGDKFVNPAYPIGYENNIVHSTTGGKVHLSNCNKLDYILANVYPNSANDKSNDWINMRLWSYNLQTSQYTLLSKSSYMHEMPNNDSWSWDSCIAMFQFDEPYEISDNEEFAVSFTFGQRREDTAQGSINCVNDSNYSYVCDGTTYNGCMLVKYGLTSRLSYMIFEGGLNDIDDTIGELTDSYDLDQEFDLNTYYGCLEYMVSYFRKKSQTTRLGWVIVPSLYSTPNNNVPILEVCQKWGVDVLNLEDKYKNFVVNIRQQYPPSKTTRWYDYNPYYFIKYNGIDNGHPSPTFFKLINGTIFNWMKSL